MKSKSLILVFLIPLFASYSQFKWQGDTSFFVINDSIISLNSPPETSDKRVYMASKAFEDAIWELEISLDFNPSSSNYCRIYFASDYQNPDDGTSYYIECGSSDDDIKLYKISNQLTSLLIDGKDGRLSNASNIFLVKVSRSKNGTLKLFYKNSDSTDYEEEGTSIDAELKVSGFFHVFCSFTSTRSDKMSFRILEISGSAPVDSIAPALDSVLVFNSHTVKLFFNEAVSVQKNRIFTDNDISVN